MNDQKYDVFSPVHLKQRNEMNYSLHDFLKMIKYLKIPQLSEKHLNYQKGKALQS